MSATRTSSMRSVRVNGTRSWRYTVVRGRSEIEGQWIALGRSVAAAARRDLQGHVPGLQALPVCLHGDRTDRERAVTLRRDREVVRDRSARLAVHDRELRRRPDVAEAEAVDGRQLRCGGALRAADLDGEIGRLAHRHTRGVEPAPAR